MSDTAATQAEATVKVEIRNRWFGHVLYTAEIPADTPSGLRMRAALEQAIQKRVNLRGSNLSGSDLSDSNLRHIRADFFDVLLRAPHEVPALRDALVEGRVNGSTYEGECACLVGTIANARGVRFNDLGHGLTPCVTRPAERWFLGIQRGDTPDTNQISRITVEWVDEFLGLIELARAA